MIFNPKINITRSLAGWFLLLISALLLIGCNNSSEDEDTNPPVINLTHPIGSEEIISTVDITWDSNETNKSSVDILLSYDSGANYDTKLASNIPDTGTYSWNSINNVDGTACRIQIIARDIVGNTSAPAESINDFVINNVPEVTGFARYYDPNQNGADAGDSIIIPFDKSLLIGSPETRDFVLPVIGDRLGADAAFAPGPKINEIKITLNNTPDLLHLKTNRAFSPSRTLPTSPSGIDVASNLSSGVISAVDTGLSALPSTPLDLIPAFSDTGESHGTSKTITAATADIDNDGDQDIIYGNNSQADEIWLNDGDGTYTYHGPLGGVSETPDIAIGDVNGDGFVDIVTAGSRPTAAHATRLWINNGEWTMGTGGFVETAQFGNETTTSVALGYLDNNTSLDLVIGNANGEPNKIWLNNGTGVFTDTGQSLGAEHTLSITLGDVNGDGNLDFVTGNYFYDGMTIEPRPNQVWINDGAGGFTDSGQLLGNGNTYSVSLGDMDGDSDLDLLTGNNSNFANSYPNKIWLNDGSGTFTDSGQDLGNGYIHETILADIDDDNDIDAVILEAGRANVWMNDGFAQFMDSGIRLRTGEFSTSGIALADVDIDRDLDLIVTQYNGGNLVFSNSLHYPGGRPARFFDSTQRFNLGTNSELVPGDIDNDGDLDLFSSNLAFEPDRVLLNDGTGRFTVSDQQIGAMRTWETKMIDIENDGDLDLIMLDFDDGNPVWLNDGAGNFTDSGVRLGTSYGSVRIGKFNNDDFPDVLKYSTDTTYTHNVELWLNDGLGGFVQQLFPLRLYRITDILLGDMDGDTNLDFVEISRDSAYNTPAPNKVWLGDGLGGFAESGQALVPTFGQSGALTDINGDNALDLITTNVQSPMTVWNNTNDNSGYIIDSGQALGFGGFSVITGDVDKDGDEDFFASSTTAAGNQLWINDGSGNFTNSGQSLGVGRYVRPHFADLDGDGDLDIVVTGFGTEPDLILLNDRY